MNLLRPAVLPLAAALLCGCGLLLPSKDPSRYHVLRSQAEAESASPLARSSGLRVAVAPARIPGYLDRKSIVRATGEHALELWPYDLWAEPLADNVARVVIGDLGVLLDSARIVSLEDPAGDTADFRVFLNVSRLEPVGNSQVLLDCAWRVSAGERERSGRSSVTIPVAAPPRGEPAAEAYVAAMSRAIGEMSHEIARAVLSLR